MGSLVSAIYRVASVLNLPNTVVKFKAMVSSGVSNVVNGHMGSPVHIL